MKKLISLLLVLCLVFALAPAAYADMISYKEYFALDKDGKDKKDLDKEIDSAKVIFLGEKHAFWYGEELDGMYYTDAEGVDHLYSCGGGEICYCGEILLSAELEAAAAKAEQDLKVWMRTSRGDDLVRHDLFVGEIEQPYNADTEDENQAYLDAKPQLQDLLEDFYDGKKLNEKLYRVSGFINTQLRSHLSDVELNRNSGFSHVEYRLMNGAWPIEVSGLGIYDSSKDADGKKYILTREAIPGDVPEHDLRVNAGGFVVGIPEDYTDKPFSLGLSFNKDGSVAVLLADDNGKAIPGAVINAALPEGAGDKTEAGTVVDGEFTAIDSTIEGGRISFTAPTGNDVFALK